MTRPARRPRGSRAQRLWPLGRLAVAALALAAAPAWGAGSTVVSVQDYRFAPARASVPRGTLVRFVWRGRAPHDVVGTGPARFHSATKTAGSFTVRLSAPGSYRVVCTIHPAMVLRLRVR